MASKSKKETPDSREIPETQEGKLRRIIEIQEELDVRKRLYEEYDRIVLELAKDGFLSAEIDDLTLNLRDHFSVEEGKNTGWTRAAVKRFDVEIISKELAEKRARRGK